MFKKVCGVLFVLLISISLTGCKTKEKHEYSIEDDVGSVMKEDVAKVFDDTSYVVYERLDEKVTIDKKEDIDKLIGIIKASNRSLGNDITFAEYLSNLYFYNESDEEIVSVNLREHENSDPTKYYNILVKSDEGTHLYYANMEDLKGFLIQYISE